jgi:excisionase family DNA binding protein
MNYAVQGGAENPRTPVEKFAYTIPEICYATGLGRTTVYDLIAKDKLRAIKAGARTLILADSIRGYLNSLTEAA